MAVESSYNVNLSIILS